MIKKNNNKKDKNEKTTVYNKGCEMIMESNEEMELPDSDFYEEIKDEGEDYYKDGRVLLVIKSGKTFIGKVQGNAETPYYVVIEMGKDGKFLYHCDCLCDYSCKHEYAVLIAIKNNEFKEIELKDKIEEEDISLVELLNKVPGDELKEYLISYAKKGKSGINKSIIRNKFKKYLPKQSYEYYYNNLYNAIILEDKYQLIVYSYLNKVHNYILEQEYEEVYKITKAILNAYKDSNEYAFTYDIVVELQAIGMFLRIAYRKGGDKIKKEIDSWKEELKKENYYNNVYLEDIMLIIK